MVVGYNDAKSKLTTYPGLLFFTDFIQNFFHLNPPMENSGVSNHPPHGFFHFTRCYVEGRPNFPMIHFYLIILIYNNMRIKNFKIFEMSITTDPMISRGNVAIYEFHTWDGFKSFFDDNPHLLRKCKWSINPSISLSQMYFEMYLKEYPYFYVIVDEDKDIVIGLSLKSEKDFFGHYADDSLVEKEVILDYLRKLNLTVEDLLF